MLAEKAKCPAIVDRSAGSNMLVATNNCDGSNPNFPSVRDRGIAATAANCE
ncbi:hypothetical protein Cha6605_4395 [Chamaesiphon minutus PCC 6605]|uniref:Uncharacterized protein n=1 Tax=Chamaesiphon minutus (strain ATCC 27169 / PCC 6605) TaxID=1173020 RepID=K9UL04_CHAP6|nr:hypothetical protein Cha6605_4395 [Chamaesiphon minutus PCC 6605]